MIKKALLACSSSRIWCRRSFAILGPFTEKMWIIFTSLRGHGSTGTPRSQSTKSLVWPRWAWRKPPRICIKNLVLSKKLLRPEKAAGRRASAKAAAAATRHRPWLRLEEAKIDRPQGWASRTPSRAKKTKNPNSPGWIALFRTRKSHQGPRSRP